MAAPNENAAGRTSPLPRRVARTIPFKPLTVVGVLAPRAFANQGAQRLLRFVGRGNHVLSTAASECDVAVVYALLGAPRAPEEAGTGGCCYLELPAPGRSVSALPPAGTALGIRPGETYCAVTNIPVRGAKTAGGLPT